jgi:hypothetical protein
MKILSCRAAMGKHGEQYNIGNLRKAGIGNFVEMTEAKRAFAIILASHIYECQ